MHNYNATDVSALINLQITNSLKQFLIIPDGLLIKHVIAMNKPFMIHNKNLGQARWSNQFLL